MTSIKAHPSVLQVIDRLDECIAIIHSIKEQLDAELYAELMSQTLVYGQFLTTSANFGVPIANPVIRAMAIEIKCFCDFVEKEIYDE